MVLATTGIIGSSLAAAEHEPVRITYLAEGACPTEQSFLEDVYARIRLGHRLDGREARRFVVSVGEGAIQSRGKVEIWATNGTVVTREVAGENCAEVARALALITALAIDPQASAAPSVPASAGPPMSLASSAPPTGTPPAVPTPSQSLASPTPTLSEAAVQLLEHGSERPSRPARWVGSVGAEGVVLVGFVPLTALGVGVFAGLRPSGQWYVWPEFRAAAVAVTTPGYWRGPADVSLAWQWVFVHGQACPVRLRAGHRDLHLVFCAAVDAGRVTAKSRGLEAADAESRAWVALGAGGRLAWEAPTGLLLESAAGIGLPLTRWSYTYDPDGQELHKISPFGAWLTLGAGYRSP